MAISDTLRGFRTQFLYTIHRVVTDCDPECLYVPEGVEDLDIKKGGQIIETVQVKNYKDKVNPSNLFSPSRTTSFFRRALETLSDNNEAIIRLVSFSNVSPDLQDANSLTKYIAKSKDKDVKKKAMLISDSYFATIVDEDTLYDEIVYALKQKFSTFNPDKELRYLLQWVYENAEHHIEFTYIDLIKEINSYNSFENRQIHALNELGLRIIPLFQESSDLDVEVLKKGFYSGLSAKSEHVLLDLDVPRPDKMEAIKSAFKEQNVVIINGASGQGKSVLSYRYIKENCALAYEISSCDRNSLASLHASLKEICNGLSVPIILYFDAKPADAAWVELIQAFSKFKNVQCLISLRNEDWNQYRSRLGCDVLYKDVELFLSKEEAHHIYDHLCPKNKQTIGSFEIVWEKLGEKVALLEFVYYITQGQALKDKLVSQWKALSSFEKSIFEVIITANYFGGKIDRNLPVLYYGHSYSAVQEAIGNYLGEFFVEDEKSFLDAVHPLRTAIIAESIYNNKQVMNNKAIELFFKSDISDAHLYLLNLLKNGLTVKELRDSAISQTVLSGKQFAGIVRAMIWKGTENYLFDVQPLIDKLRKEVGGLWELYLPVNFTEIDIKQSLDNLLSNFPNVPDVSNIVDSFPTQESIFIYLNNYLDNQIFINLQSHEDWVIAADALYRISLSKHSSRIHLSGQIDAKNLHVDEVSRILLGLKSLGLKRDCWKSLEDSFVEKLRLEYLLMSFQISESSIETTTFIRYTTDENSPVQKTKDQSTNSHLVKIIDLLRMAFPEKINYHVKLGEDALSTMALDKEKNIQKINLPLGAMHEIRSCVVNQYKNNIGILDKAEYVEKLIAFRKELTIANRHMVSIFVKWWKTGKFDSAAYMDVHQCFVSAGSNIPQPSYVSSNIFGYGDIKNIPQNTSWDLFMKELTSYVANLSSFYTQLPRVLADKDFNKMPSKACLFDALLAVRCLQIKFKELFSPYIPDSQKYDILEKSEYNDLLSLWVIWETQCRNIKGMDFTTQMTRYKQMEDTLPKALIDNIKNRFLQEGIACDAHIANKDFNISIFFKNESEYNKAYEMKDHILKDAFCKYDTYTSQEYTLRTKFENIIVQFLFVSSIGTHHRINSLISSCDVRHMLNQSSKDNAFSTTLFVPDYLPIFDEKLGNYEKVMGLAKSILVIAQQLLSMYQYMSNNDELGETIIEKYKEECIAECMTYKDSIGELKTSLSNIADNPWHAELNRMIYLLEKVLDTKNLLSMCDEIDTQIQLIFTQDIEIRLALLNNFKYPT